MLSDDAFEGFSPEIMTTLPMMGRLNLTPDELAALRQQGFVSSERRKESVYYQLRFRHHRKQRVVYLGKNRQLAIAVEADLAVHQREARQQRELAVFGRLAKRQLRDAKQVLKRSIEDLGYHFHGQSVRRQRLPKVADENTKR